MSRSRGQPVRGLAMSLLALLVAACAAEAPPAGNVAGTPNWLSPFYGVTPDLMRPDGTMDNGLLPINPDDQS